MKKSQTQSSKKSFGLIDYIVKFELIWLFLYIVFSLILVILAVCATFIPSQSRSIALGGMILINLLSIASIALHLIASWDINRTEMFKNWKNLLGISLLVVNLIPIFVLIGIYGNLALTPGAEWSMIIFSFYTLIIGIATTVGIYRENYPLLRYEKTSSKNNDEENIIHD